MTNNSRHVLAGQSTAVQLLSVGLPRSGSKSMVRALELLGYSNIHHLGQIFWKPREWVFFENAADACFPSLSTFNPDAEPVDWDSAFGHNDVITDAAGIFTEQLIRQYPEAKVVLVVRDFDKWATSFDETMLSYVFSWYGWFSSHFIDPMIGACSTMALRKMFMGMAGMRSGSMLRRREILRWHYERHHKLVRQLVPEDRLCEYRLGDGWEPLCEFLGKDVPTQDFPHLNDALEVHYGWYYLRVWIFKTALRKVSLFAVAGGAASALLMLASRRYPFHRLLRTT